MFNVSINYCHLLGVCGLVGFLNSGLAIADVANDHCMGDDIIKIQRPYYPDRPNSERFVYSFRLSRDANPDAPYVIYLPGGPGNTSMESSRFGIPAGAHVVTTDPRGVGCNAFVRRDVSDEALQTRYLASDILAVVSYLQPKQYILYGQSYGTVLAIVAAHMAEEVGQHPAGVVLEGILGRAITPEDDVTAAFWSRAKSRLSPEVREQFNAEKLPLGFSGEAWGSFISLIFNGGIQPVVSLLEFLSPNAPTGHRQILKNMVAAIATADASDTKTPADVLFRAIACRELQQQGRKYILERGELKLVGENVCEGKTLDHRFDSARYQILAPIYYFEGEEDRATPLAMARYHFDNQRKAPKFFVTIPEIGHMSPITSLGDCKDLVWNSILSGDTKQVAPAIATCKTMPTLDSVQPESNSGNPENESRYLPH